MGNYNIIFNGKKIAKVINPEWIEKVTDGIWRAYCAGMMVEFADGVVVMEE